jgi:hypothetical protein
MEGYLRRNLIAFITDGAAVFRGVRNSVSTRFQKWMQPSNRAMIGIHCAPHRLQVALTHSYKKFDVIITIESFLNDLANFYYGPSHKRAAHLEALSELLKEKSYRYHKIFHIRWIVSEQEAVMKVIKSYKLLIRFS